MARLATNPGDNDRTTSRPSSTDIGWAGELVGKYMLGDEIASGGMATVCLGQLKGAAGFTRMVAIKRLHSQYARDEEFVARFKDEARLAARVLHPNVAQVLDLVECHGELLLVMEYVHGVSLRAVQIDAADAGKSLPIGLVGGILVPALYGLHAAHETVDDDGVPLKIVHRDFSPQNVVVGQDGHARIVDFGVAQAARQQHVTLTGSVTGKLGFMSPEQISGDALDRRSDVFAAGIVLWEALTGSPLFRRPGQGDAATLRNVLEQTVVKPSSLRSEIPVAMDEIVLRALQRDPGARFATAMDLGNAIEQACSIDSPGRVSLWLNVACAARLQQAAQLFAKARMRSGPVATPSSFRKVQTTVPSALAALPPVPSLPERDQWSPRGPQSVREPAELLRTKESAMPDVVVPSRERSSSMASVQTRRRPCVSDLLVAIATLLTLLLMGFMLLKGENRPKLAPRLHGSATSSAKAVTPAAPSTARLPVTLAVVSSDNAGSLPSVPSAEDTHTLAVPETSASAPPAEREPALGASAAAETPLSSAALAGTAPPLAPPSRGALARSRRSLALGTPSGAPPASSPAIAERPAKAKKVTAEVAPVKSKAGLDCSPPTYWDADNVRKFKPGCI